MSPKSESFVRTVVAGAIVWCGTWLGLFVLQFIPRLDSFRHTMTSGEYLMLACVFIFVAAVGEAQYVPDTYSGGFTEDDAEYWGGHDRGHGGCEGPDCGGRDG